MSTRCVHLLLLLFLAPWVSFGQVPHLEGTVQVSVQGGTIDARLTLSNLPAFNNYTIWLNSGLNIEYFRDVEGTFNYAYNTEYNNELSGEALQHYFPSADNRGRFLPEAFRVSYTGKFPVITDTATAYDWGDWKGNMAFNGQTLRASEQSAWYPILYDKTHDVVIDKYTFNLTIRCTDCPTIYLNGDEPKQGPTASFQSEEAVPLLLFMGDYDYIENNGIYVLNADLNAQKLNTLTGTTQQIIQFYERILQTPYGAPVVYISTTPVSKKNEWMFVTYPTIAVVGIDAYKLENYFDNQTFEFKQKQHIVFIAHELAHYYIGTLFVPNSELRWLFLEGVTDYLSLKAAKELLGADIFQIILNNYLGQAKDLKSLPLDRIEVAGQINEAYRYTYVPLLLLAIEKEIGEANLYLWVRGLLRSRNTLTDYAFLIESLRQTGLSNDVVEQLASTYFTHPNAIDHIRKQLE